MAAIMSATETVNFANLKGYSLGRYRLQNLLGFGAMGNVYKSRHPDLKRDIAVKILHPHHTQVPGFVERFRHEAAAAATLIHPNIIQIFDFDVAENNLYYMVLQYINGPSLEDYLSLEQRPLSLLKTYELITPIVGALHYAHQQGVIHRDVKPGNIMLDTRQRVYLGDFGLAKIIGVSMNTQSGLGAGTPAYMAPEQIEAAPITPATDIYALGVMLYKMLTTKLPFDGENIMNLIMRKMTEPAPPLRQLNPDVPIDVEAVILKAISKEPEARYTDAVSFVADLRQAIGGHVLHLPKFDIDTAVSSGFVALPSIQIENYKVQREFASDQTRLYQRYLARNEALESTAVLTILRQTTERNPALNEAFQNRLDMLAVLDHPGLASITRIGQTAEQRPFAAYAFVPGQSLATRLNQEWTRPEKCLPIPASLALVRAIAEALNVAHLAGLVHQELSPEQIIIQTDNRPVIVGLEIPAPPPIDAKTLNTNTPGYTPPELYAGNPVSVQSNIYALGLMLYELLSGNRPPMPMWNLAYYAAADVPAAVPLALHRSQLAPETNRLLGKCLATEPTQRFTNVADFLAHLDAAAAAERRFQEPSAVLTSAAAPALPGRRWYALLLFILVLLAIGAFLLRGQLAATPVSTPTQTPTAVTATASATTTRAPATASATAVPIVVPPATPSATASATLTATPTATASATPSATASQAACVIPPGWVRYTVQFADTFTRLAAAAGTTVSAILEGNCLDDFTLRVGQPLWLPRLPVTATVTAVTPSPSPSPTATLTEPPPPSTAVNTPIPTLTPTLTPAATDTPMPTLTPPPLPTFTPPSP